MANVLLNWTLPVPTARQRPLSHVRIETRLSGIAEWTELNTVAAPGNSLQIDDLAPGDWQFQGIVVDDADAESSPLGASISMAFDGPSPLTAFTATLA